MMKLNTIVIVAVLGLPITSPAWGECAWVLWESAGPTIDDKTWAVKDAHETRAACDAALTKEVMRMIEVYRAARQTA